MVKWWDNFLLACKLFWRTFKESERARLFLEKKEPPALSSNDAAHLRLLALLQQESRLVDFLKEEIAPFTDAQIGAAVRKIHEQCGKALEEFVTIRPLFQEAEGSEIVVPQGYDENVIKVIGKVHGQPPYRGILRHKGWKGHKLSLPKQISKANASVISPAEIEIK